MINLNTFLRCFSDVAITPEQQACCRYLEQRGKRFCVDFGYENAPAMVWSEIDAEIDERNRASERWLD